MDPTLIKDALVNGQVTDVRFDRTIRAIGRALAAQPGDTVVDARGLPLLPGLHDHHLHLLALHSARQSVDCGPRAVDDLACLGRVLEQATGDGWVRGVGYDESTLGELTRWDLDRVFNHRPLRLQHRSGKLWVLNSAATDLLGLANERDPGIERDRHGNVTGRLFRMDAWLAMRLEQHAPPDLSALWQELFSYGITGVTDASYTNSRDTVAAFEQRRANGELMPEVCFMGDETLSSGPLKVMLDDERLPELSTLIGRVRAAHERDRPVAFHCVSHLQLVFALTALDGAGHHPRDRIEHGAVISSQMLGPLRDSGCTVVTQPGFIADRGEQFKAGATPSEWGDLYRFKTLRARGIEVIASSDAPYGPVSPPAIVRAAMTRTTNAGLVLGAGERVSADEAWRGYWRPKDLGGGGEPLRVRRDGPADLCLVGDTGDGDLRGESSPIVAVWRGGVRVR